MEIKYFKQSCSIAVLHKYFWRKGVGSAGALKDFGFRTVSTTFDNNQESRAMLISIVSKPIKVVVVVVVIVVFVLVEKY